MTDEPPRIRDVGPADMAAIAAIYAHYVEQSTFSFEETAPSVAELDRRREVIAAQNLPYLVAEAPDGRILGYAYAGLYRLRSAYRYTVEDTVYLAPDATSRGIGRSLLTTLIDICTERGHRQMVAVIGDSGNRTSVAFHRRMGFSEAGVLQAAGYKFGRWLDSVLMQRPLGDGDDTPPTR